MRARSQEAQSAQPGEGVLLQLLHLVVVQVSGKQQLGCFHHPIIKHFCLPAPLGGLCLIDDFTDEEIMWKVKNSQLLKTLTGGETGQGLDVVIGEVSAQRRTFQVSEFQVTLNASQSSTTPR